MEKSCNNCKKDGCRPLLTSMFCEDYEPKVTEKVETIKEKIEIARKILDEIDCKDCEYSNRGINEKPCDVCAVVRVIKFEEKIIKVDFAEAFKSYKQNKVIQAFDGEKFRLLDEYLTLTAVSNVQIDRKWIIHK
jgi:hypothetical protein